MNNTVHVCALAESYEGRTRRGRRDAERMGLGGGVDCREGEEDGKDTGFCRRHTVGAHQRAGTCCDGLATHVISCSRLCAGRTGTDCNLAASGSKEGELKALVAKEVKNRKRVQWRHITYRML